MNSLPQPGEFYRHFKNKLYQIVTVATHSETLEKMVVYQALYGDYGIYVRPLDMFISEVDHKKYPDVVQKYRFERVTMPLPGNSPVTRVHKEAVIQEKAATLEAVYVETELQQAEEAKINPYLLEFLDADTYSDKIEVLNRIRKKLTEDLIQTIAVSLDYTLGDGDLEEHYESVLYYLETHARYEGNRLR